MARFLPQKRQSLFLRDSLQLSKKIGNRSSIGLDGGQWGRVCKLYFVLCDLVGDNMGRAGMGVWIGHGDTLDFFCRLQILFVSEYQRRREKIRSDLKKVNATWSL
jgi:hypothetical protein